MPKRLSYEERRARETLDRLDKNDIQKIGEHSVAVECYKRGWKTSILSGGTKTIDLLIWNPKTKNSVSAQVKSRKKHGRKWHLVRLPSPEKITVPIVAVFFEFTEVSGNKIMHDFNFYVIPPIEAEKLIERDPSDYYWMIKWEDIQQFEDKWDLLWE